MSTLFEEWVFLQENSVILARLRRTFDTFARAGATYLHLGEVAHPFHVAVRRTLHLEATDAIGRSGYARAVAKWIAIGGPSLVGLPLGIPPIWIAASSLASGFFLQMDP